MKTQEKAGHTKGPGPWELFKAPHLQGGWGVGKNNSFTQIYYFDNYPDAKRKYLELARPEWEAKKQAEINIKEAAPKMLEALVKLSAAFGSGLASGLLTQEMV